MMKHLFTALLCSALIAFNANNGFAALQPDSLSDCLEVSHCVRIDWKVDNLEESFKKALDIVSSTPRTVIVEKNSSYIHAEASSRLMHFVDDLEIMKVKDKDILQIRSESRLGIGDMGVNKRRVVNLLNLL